MSKPGRSFLKERTKGFDPAILFLDWRRTITKYNQAPFLTAGFFENPLENISCSKYKH
jgi:hypothetical protein